MNKEKIMKFITGTLAGLLLTSLGFNVQNVVDSKGNIDFPELLKQELKVIVTEVVKEEIKELKSDVSELKKSNIEEITARAIGAYTKVFTIEDLNSSPEKRYSIEAGLKLDSCKAILMTIDRDRTILFYDYLIKDAY